MAPGTIWLLGGPICSFILFFETRSHHVTQTCHPPASLSLPVLVLEMSPRPAPICSFSTVLSSAAAPGVQAVIHTHVQTLKANT